MTRDELLARLREIAGRELHDAEVYHEEADRALLEYINDPEIADAWDAIEKWYA